MKRLILVVWILSLIGSCSDNENGTKPHLPLNYKYSVESLQKDYTQLVRVVEKNHPALYDFSTKKRYERLLKIQYEKISDSLTIADFYKVVTPVLSEIGCGHSTLRLPEWVWSDSATTLLPLKLFFQGKKGNVIVNYTSHEIPGGAEILSINSTTIPKILERIEYRIPTDGDNISTKRELLNYFFNELFAIQEGFPDSYDISFRPPKTNSIQHMNISSITAKSFLDERPKMGSLLRFEIDTARSTGIMTIKSFAFYDSLKEFKVFVDTSFNRMQEDKIDHLILDLRNNGGGDPFCAAHLLGYLAKTPITYFSESYPSYAELARPLHPFENRFSGKIYILINGICFSTTGHLCALLKYHNIGEFIGTETGGTYTCNDDSQTFQLINTGILVRMPRATFSVAVEGIPRFKGILPDHIIEPSLEDILNSNDRVKEFALSRIEVISNRD